MIEQITYTGPAYSMDENQDISDEPTEISGTFDVIDIDTNERGTAIYVADKDENEYMIDGADAMPDIDVDTALDPDEEE